MSKTSSLRHPRNVKAATLLFQNRRTLLQMLRDVYHGRYSMSLVTMIAIIAGLIYIISPLDFDWIPIIGWIDDGVVFYLVIQCLQRETHRYNRMKAMSRKLDKGN